MNVVWLAPIPIHTSGLASFTRGYDAADTRCLLSGV
jgi:hypothetical protein